MPKAPKCMSFSYMQLRIPEVALCLRESRKVLFIAVLLPAAGHPADRLRRASLPRVRALCCAEFCSTHDSNTVFVAAKIRGFLPWKRDSKDGPAQAETEHRRRLTRARRPLRSAASCDRRRSVRAQSSPRTTWRHRTASASCPDNRADCRSRRIPGSSHV